MNHLILPMIQRWLRRQTKNDTESQWRENKFEVRNFKQCVGLMVEAVVKYTSADPGMFYFVCGTRNFQKNVVILFIFVLQIKL